MIHTINDDFEHFLSASGYRNESPEVIEKLRVAFHHAWSEVSEEKHPGFQEQLRDLINRYSMEEHSNTPDFILAEFLNVSLQAFGLAMAKRDRWYAAPQKAAEQSVQSDVCQSSPDGTHAFGEDVDGKTCVMCGTRR